LKNLAFSDQFPSPNYNGLSLLRAGKKYLVCFKEIFNRWRLCKLWRWCKSRIF